MSDKMREEFEQWLNQGNHCGCNENMWKAWQAAHAAALPPGFVAVPVEPTKAMERAAGIEGGVCMCCGYGDGAGDPATVYAAMLSARPEVK